MTEKAVLEDIGITKAGVFEGDTYTIELDNDTEWGRVFSLLEKSELVEEVGGGELTANGGAFYYEYTGNDDELFYITLSSSFDDDSYTLSIEREE